jgi:hypothetical protein
MAFTANNIQTTKTEKPLPSTQLLAKEIEVLLSLVKQSTFAGADVELIYNLVLKLQTQYLEQTNTKK